MIPDAAEIAEWHAGLARRIVSGGIDMISACAYAEILGDAVDSDMVRETLVPWLHYPRDTSMCPLARTDMRVAAIRGLSHHVDHNLAVMLRTISVTDTSERVRIAAREALAGPAPRYGFRGPKK